MRGDQPDKANEKYSIDKLTRLKRAMMSGINGGLLRSAFKKSKKTFKIIFNDGLDNKIIKLLINHKIYNLF